MVEKDSSQIHIQFPKTIDISISEDKTYLIITPEISFTCKDIGDDIRKYVKPYEEKVDQKLTDNEGQVSKQDEEGAIEDQNTRNTGLIEVNPSPTNFKTKNISSSLPDAPNFVANPIVSTNFTSDTLSESGHNQVASRGSLNKVTHNISVDTDGVSRLSMESLESIENQSVRQESIVKIESQSHRAGKMTNVAPSLDVKKEPPLDEENQIKSRMGNVSPDFTLQKDQLEEEEDKPDDSKETIEGDGKVALQDNKDNISSADNTGIHEESNSQSIVKSSSEKLIKELSKSSSQNSLQLVSVKQGNFDGIDSMNDIELTSYQDAVKNDEKGDQLISHNTSLSEEQIQIHVLPEQEDIPKTKKIQEKNGMVPGIRYFVDLMGLVREIVEKLRIDSRFGGEPFFEIMEELYTADQHPRIKVQMFTEDQIDTHFVVQAFEEIGIGRIMGSISVIPISILHYPFPHHQLQQISGKKVKQAIRKKKEKEEAFLAVAGFMRVEQLLSQIMEGAVFSFDYMCLVIIASALAGVGLAMNSVVVIVASMLVSPIMGPVLAGTFGFCIRDRSLIKVGIISELFSLLLCVLVGAIIALCTHPWHNVLAWPTEEMIARCTLSGLVWGSIVALTSGFGVALSVLGNNTSCMVGVAISASLLPPAVNCGMMLFYGAMEYDAVMRRQRLAEGLTSLTLTLVNILFIFIAGNIMFFVKEVAPIKGKTNFWSYDVQAARNVLQAVQGNFENKGSTTAVAKAAEDNVSLLSGMALDRQNHQRNSTFVMKESKINDDVDEIRPGTHLTPQEIANNNTIRDKQQHHTKGTTSNGSIFKVNWGQNLSIGKGRKIDGSYDSTISNLTNATKHTNHQKGHSKYSSMGIEIEEDMEENKRTLKNLKRRTNSSFGNMSLAQSIIEGNHTNAFGDIDPTSIHSIDITSSSLAQNQHRFTSSFVNNTGQGSSFVSSNEHRAGRTLSGGKVHGQSMNSLATLARHARTISNISNAGNMEDLSAIENMLKTTDLRRIIMGNKGSNRNRLYGSNMSLMGLGDIQANNIMQGTTGRSMLNRSTKPSLLQLFSLPTEYSDEGDSLEEDYDSEDVEEYSPEDLEAGRGG